MPNDPSRPHAQPSPVVLPDGVPATSRAPSLDPSDSTLDWTWHNRRKQLAHALQHHAPTKLRVGINALPAATWPRWNPERAWAMLDPDAQRRLERMGHHAACTVPAPHDLLACLTMNPGWLDDPDDAALMAVLDRLIAEGEPLDRCAATNPEHGWVLWTPPLYRAALLGLDALVVRLLDAGASPDVSILHEQGGITTPGHTALYMAVQKTSLATVERLIAAGASVMPPDPEAPIPRGQMKGDAPLHAAARRFPRSAEEVIESQAILDRLVQAGAPVNAPNEKLGGPLHAAVAQGHPALVEHLLTLGADPCQRNGSGESPWDTAQRHEQRWLGQTPMTAVETSAKARVLAVAGAVRKTVVAHEAQALRTTLDTTIASGAGLVTSDPASEAPAPGVSPTRRRL